MFDKPDTGSRAGATAAAIDLRRLVARQAFPLAVIVTLVWLGWDTLTGLDFARVTASLGQLNPSQWLTGVVFTGVSFWAVRPVHLP